MEDLLFSLNAIVPLVLCCAAGWSMRHWGMISDAFKKDCSNLVFFVTIPCSIFMSIAQSDFREVFDGKLILFLFVSNLVLAVLCSVFCHRFIQDRRVAATVALDIYRSNFTLLGVPLAINLLGTEGAAPMMLLVCFGNVICNVFSVIILSRTEEQEKTGLIREILVSAWSVAKNPMTIASVLGIMVAAFGLPLPLIVSRTADSFASMCSGLALFMLGAQTELANLRRNWRYTAVTAVFRLLIVPVIAVFIAIALRFEGNSLVALMIYFASPVGLTCSILAETMGGDGQLAGESVLVTTCLSAFTFTIAIYIFKVLEFI